MTEMKCSFGYMTLTFNNNYIFWNIFIYLKDLKLKQKTKHMEKYIVIYKDNLDFWADEKLYNTIEDATEWGKVSEYFYKVKSIFI